MNEQNILTMFYALTPCGIWIVSAKRHHGCVPTVRLICKQPETQTPVGTTLRNGNLVAVTSKYIGLYHHRPSLKIIREVKTVTLALPEQIDADDTGDKTSRLIACFLDPRRALEANRKSDLTHAGNLYDKDTKEVLRRIGENHPVFVVSRDGNLGFSLMPSDDVGIGRNSNPTFPEPLLSFGMKADTIEPQQLPPENGEPPPKIQRPSMIKYRRETGRTRPRTFVAPKPSRTIMAEHVVQPHMYVSTYVRPITPQPLPEQAVPTGKKFLVFATARMIRKIVNGIATQYIIQPGKYEMEERPSPIPDSRESWWILAQFQPEIVGNAIYLLRPWIGCGDPEKEIRLVNE